ncbi:MAG: TIR domain-containing protein [Clostridium sp.]|jgi:hypothetical protein|nr:TIR domain-containing protein [Clostridium sp.]
MKEVKDMVYDVFISHSSKDRPIANAICHMLEANGVRCWIAPRDVPAGIQFGAAITRGIRESAVFLLLFSTDANRSLPVQGEVASAFDMKKYIIPYRLDDVEISDEMYYYISGLHWLDIKLDNSIFDNLVNIVTKKLGKKRKTYEVITADLDSEKKDGFKPEIDIVHDVRGKSKRFFLSGMIVGGLDLIAVIILFSYSLATSNFAPGGLGITWWILLLLGIGAGAVVGLLLLAKRYKKVSSAMQIPEQPDFESAEEPTTPNTPESAAPKASFQLLCSSGYYASTTFTLNNPLSMGRDPKRCQIIFPGDTKGISSLHCEISPLTSGVLLTDKNSTYGTFLANGRKLKAGETVSLRVGDGFYLADPNNMFKIKGLSENYAD